MSAKAPIFTGSLAARPAGGLFSMNDPKKTVCLREIASPKAHALATKIRAIEQESRDYLKAAGEVFQIRTDLEERLRVLGDQIRQNPSTATMRQIMAARAEADAFDRSNVRLWNSDELAREVIPRRHPDMGLLANELCQQVVNITHPDLEASRSQDAKAALDLGAPGLTSARTKSLENLVEIAMQGSWASAKRLAGLILDGDEPAGGIPQV
ncbi:MAG TPA: hypothetical protein PLS03_06815 [Terrimicrobiaceae bacterium]|nr:hypothetical protein [Terrimicrobiaceae bacterium]